MNWSQNVGDPTIYWLLYTLLVLVLAYCGWGISYKDEKDFNKYAITAGTFYSLIEGLRWMRGADYYHYYMDLLTDFQNLSYCTPKPELLYKLWVDVFYSTGLSPHVAFVFYSALLIWAYLLILKHYRKAAVWALPVFFLITGATTENIIRQYFATSFMLFAYSAYLDGKKKLMYILLCAVPLIHISGLYGVALFLFFTHVKIKDINPLVFFGIYLFAYYIWNQSWLQGFADFISTLNFSDNMKLNAYTENADRWFTDEGSIAAVLGEKSAVTSLLYNSVMILTNSAMVYYGYIVCRDDKKLILAYYFAFIGLIIRTIGGDIEIITRFSHWTNWMIPFIFGLLYYKIDIKKSKYIKPALFVVFSIRFIFYGIIRAFGSIPYAGCGFIWDK